ncbi:N-acetylmuramoyl-L-alanine amidase family protein [Clostridium sp. chh4-2]|uniref:N-acetylmuramoyl-L-alanine amidase family protein n=1 Tax=Clostridium sp. chh4-2 TaxID=2067550 RepID=UPI000CD13AD7|nr:N-acetylmuramoyl-L-alanine amidase family protein [Clostridium sp. chh4-2]
MRQRVQNLLRGVVLSALMVILASAPAFSAEPVQLEGAENTWWEDDTTAAWTSVKKAKQYQVRLYENEVSVVKLTVNTNRADFKDYMQDGYQYYFEVRAVAKNSEQSYVEDGPWVSSKTVDMSDRGDTSGRWRNYADGNKYQMEDGSLASDGWKLISGSWYYFDGNGYSKTGWLEDGGSRYFLSEDGRMTKGWREIGGYWYYFQKDGAMSVGWVQPEPGKWYYMQEDGTMASDVTVDGCQLDVSGLWMPS